MGSMLYSSRTGAGISALLELVQTVHAIGVTEPDLRKPVCTARMVSARRSRRLTSKLRDAGYWHSVGRWSSRAAMGRYYAFVTEGRRPADVINSCSGALSDCRNAGQRIPAYSLIATLAVEMVRPFAKPCFTRMVQRGPIYLIQATAAQTPCPRHSRIVGFMSMVTHLPVV